LAGEPVVAKLTKAPGNHAAIGGLKVVSASGWFAARPSGTENIYKIYAESFQDEKHLQAIFAGLPTEPRLPSRSVADLRTMESLLKSRWMRSGTVAGFCSSAFAMFKPIEARTKARTNRRDMSALLPGDHLFPFL
jgi:hypothetical protein